MLLSANGRPLCCARSLRENGGVASIELTVAARDASSLAVKRRRAALQKTGTGSTSGSEPVSKKCGRAPFLWEMYDREE